MHDEHIDSQITDYRFLMAVGGNHLKGKAFVSGCVGDVE